MQFGFKNAEKMETASFRQLEKPRINRTWAERIARPPEDSSLPFDKNFQLITRLIII